MADNLNPDPSSTWGASDEYKARWHEEYGLKEPAEGASKADWLEYADKRGVTGVDDSMTRADIQAAVRAESGTAGTGPEAAPGKVGVADTGTPTSTSTAQGR